MRRNVLVLLIASATLLGSPAHAASPSGDARPLAGRGADNLTAFARLLAYIRFFHPSDEAAAADWNRVAVAGIGAVEDAPDPASLARALEGFFRPLAPTVRVFPTGERPELDPALRPPAGGSSRIVAWRHYGGKFDGTVRSFYSARIDNVTLSFGTILQAVAPGDLKGRRVRLRARVRAETKPNGRFQLGLRVERPGGQPGFFDNMADRPLHTTDWRTIEIEGDVAPDAERLIVQAVLTGEGKVWLDEVSLEPVQGPVRDRTARILLNPGFDEGEPGTEPPGWYFPYEDSLRMGYHLELRRGESCLQGGCVELSSDELAAPPRLPRPEEPLEVDLGGGVSALVPTSLYADGRGTLPRSAPGAPPPPWSGADPALDARDNRLAALALAWGILAHFHPTLDLSPEDWAAALRSALPEAAAAGDRETYRRAVLRLLAHVDDPVVNEYIHRDDPEEIGSLPIAWEWIEDRLVITAPPQGDTSVRRGDIVLEIDGQPAGDAIAAAQMSVSAATPPARLAFTLLYLATGPPGSAVSLRLERPGEPPFTATLKREGSGGTLPDLPPPVTEPRHGIVYVNLRRLDDAELERQLPRLAKAKGVVFDLRGFTKVSTLLLSHLAPQLVNTLTWEIPVFQRPDRQMDLFLHTVTRITPQAPRITGRLAFLTDARTSQHSERMLETIEAYHWGEIVGAPSGGHVGNPNWSNLPGGWTIYWTGRRGLKHDGKTVLNRTGILPTVPAARTLRGVAEGRDEVVERAVEIVSQ